MATLFFDTETTHLKNDRLPDTDPEQPMPVQLGLKLDDEDHKEVGATNVIIKAKHGEYGWPISPGAQAIHKIDVDKTLRYGIDIIPAVEMFLDYVDAADTIVAHNTAFDTVVMRRAVYVYSFLTDQPYTDPFEGKNVVCTMLAATDIVKAKPKRYGTWKWPKLEECIRFWYNESLDGAHDALIDVRACARIYYQMQQEGVLK